MLVIIIAGSRYPCNRGASESGVACMDASASFTSKLYLYEIWIEK